MSHTATHANGTGTGPTVATMSAAAVVLVPSSYQRGPTVTQLRQLLGCVHSGPRGSKARARAASSGATCPLPPSTSVVVAPREFVSERGAPVAAIVLPALAPGPALRAIGPASAADASDGCTVIEPNAGLQHSTVPAADIGVPLPLATTLPATLVASCPSLPAATPAVTPAVAAAPAPAPAPIVVVAPLERQSSSTTSSTTSSTSPSSTDDRSSRDPREREDRGGGGHPRDRHRDRHRHGDDERSSRRSRSRSRSPHYHQHQHQRLLTSALSRHTHQLHHSASLQHGSHASYAQSHSRRLLRVLVQHRILAMLQKSAHIIRPYGVLVFLANMSEQMEPEDVREWMEHALVRPGWTSGAGTNTGDETTPLQSIQGRLTPAAVAASTTQGADGAAFCTDPAGASVSGVQPTSISPRSSGGGVSGYSSSSQHTSPQVGSSSLHLFARLCGLLFPVHRSFFLDYSASPLECTPYDEAKDFPPVASLRFFSQRDAILAIPMSSGATLQAITGQAHHAAPQQQHQQHAESVLVSVRAPRSVQHAVWCPWLRPGDACACDGCSVISCGVVVNAAFEKLVGWSQAELRHMFLADGFKAFFRLVRFESWARQLDSHLRDMLTGTGEHYGRIELTTKQGHLIKCLHLSRGSLDRQAAPGMWQSFIPLPAEGENEE